MKVVEIQNPAALQLPEVTQLFERACDAEDFPDPKWLLRDLEALLPDSAFGVLVARDDAGDLKGLVLCESRTSALSPLPWVAHFYVDPGSGAKGDLGDALREWFHERGFDRVRAVNLSAMTDDEHIRAFRSIAEGRPKATILEYDLTEGT